MTGGISSLEKSMGDLAWTRDIHNCNKKGRARGLIRGDKLHPSPQNNSIADCTRGERPT